MNSFGQCKRLSSDMMELSIMEKDFTCIMNLWNAVSRTTVLFLPTTAVKPRRNYRKLARMGLDAWT